MDEKSWIGTSTWTPFSYPYIRALSRNASRRSPTSALAAPAAPRRVGRGELETLPRGRLPGPLASGVAGGE